MSRSTTPPGLMDHPRRSSRGSARARALAYSRARVWSLTVWFAALAWAIALIAIMRDHYLHFRIGRFDLGNMVQSVWNTAHGHPLGMTDGLTGEQIVRLAYHVDPILVLFAPLWIVYPSPLMLVAVQAGAIASGALPVFWLARRHLASERAAALLALAYLAYPWTAWAVVDVFHPFSLALPLLLYAVWFLDGDRLLPFAACAVLAASTGELVGLTIAALGVWYALARGRALAGGLVVGAGVAWSMAAVFLVVPVFAGGPSVFQGTLDDRVGGSPSGLVETAVTDPLAVLSAATEAGDVAYLVLMAAPLLGAFVLAPGLAAVALPQLAVNLLADFGATTDPRAHYVAPVIPFFFAAIALGLGRFEARTRSRGVVAVLTVSVAASVMLGPWSAMSIGTPAWFRAHDSADAVAVRRAAVALVPHDAPVSATNQLGAHLAGRRYLASVPTVGRAEWVVVDVDDDWRPQAWGGTHDPVALGAFVRRLSTSPAWEQVFDERGILVFRKVSP